MRSQTPDCCGIASTINQERVKKRLAAKEADIADVPPVHDVEGAADLGRIDRAARNSETGREVYSTADANAVE